VATFGEIGTTDKGRKKLSYIIQRTYHAESEGIFEDMIAKQLVDDCIKYGVEPNGLGIDISADGGKMLSAIIRYWLNEKKNPKAADVYPISSMGKPTDRIVSNVDPRKCLDAYDRRVTEYWMMVREAALCEILCNVPRLDEDGQGLHPIVSQLCSRIYVIKSKKFVIETKDDYKERTGSDSPDNADSFVYMVEMARRHGLVFQSPDDRTRLFNRLKEEREKQKSREYSYATDSWGEEAA